jgi:trk system potassium uptake protein TrkH
VTNFTAVLATLNNIGPGLEQVGPTGNFASFTPFSKYVLMFNMLAGRLELYPMLMILNYGMWKSAFAPKMKSGILNLKNKEK